MEMIHDWYIIIPLVICLGLSGALLGVGAAAATPAAATPAAATPAAATAPPRGFTREKADGDGDADTPATRSVEIVAMLISALETCQASDTCSTVI